jgi:SagB-type dehydrogenase family enzyme
MIIPPMIALSRVAKLVLSNGEAIKVVSHRVMLDLLVFPDIVRFALGRLTTKPVSQSLLVELVLNDVDPTPVACLYHALMLFAQHGLLSYVLYYKGLEILTLCPMSGGPLFEPHDVPNEQPFRLSRFAFLRRDCDQIIIESPVSATRIWIGSDVLSSLFFGFDAPKTLADLVKTNSPDLVQSILSYLFAAKVITACDFSGRTEEDNDPGLRQWEFHDLSFHAHARVGKHSDPLGAHFPFDGVCPPPPALKLLPSSPPIPLYRPNLQGIASSQLTEVMEQRHTWRYFDDTAPITAEQLGTFLYRTARVRALYKCSDHLANRYDQTNRPYPNGGAMYELELYVTVRMCKNLEPGIYYYDPLAHALHLVSRSKTSRSALLNQASISAAGISVPQVLITMTSRFQRMSWKYNTIAYGTTLKHVGVLMGMMYLVASDMGLAACALGSGLAELAPGDINLNFFIEAPVGDFMLGSRGTPQPEQVVSVTPSKHASSLSKEIQAFMLDPGSVPDPSHLYAKLLKEDSLFRIPSGAVLVSSYKDVIELIGHPLMSVVHRKNEKAYRLAQIPEIDSCFHLMMSMRDPPDHDRIAALMREHFKPAAVNALNAKINFLIDQSLRPHLSEQNFDIVSSIAKNLPVQVTCTMLGISRDDWPELQTWTELLARQLSDFTQPQESLIRVKQELEFFSSYITNLLGERRRVPKDNDILTTLIMADPPLSEQELIAQCMLLLIGGRETVTNMISNSVLLMLQYPQQFEVCRRNPDLIPAALEECLRFESPIRIVARTLMGSLVHGMYHLQEGDTLLFLIAAANRDPSFFSAPNMFDTERKLKRNLAFGRGPHSCIGRYFARAEGVSVLRWLLLNGGAIEWLEPTREPAWENSLPFRGLTHLNIRMHPDKC